MKLKTKFIDHGPVDISGLLNAVSKITQQHWYAWGARNEPTIIFQFLDNNAPRDNWDQIEHRQQNDWLEKEVYPVAKQLNEKLSGRIVKLMLIAVEPYAINGNFHSDSHAILRAVHRCHMPLIQSVETRYHVGGEEFPMKVGHWYEKDNTLTHAVINYSPTIERRVSLQCDILPLDNSRTQKYPEYYY